MVGLIAYNSALRACTSCKVAFYPPYDFLKGRSYSPQPRRLGNVHLALPPFSSRSLELLFCIKLVNHMDASCQRAPRIACQGKAPSSGGHYAYKSTYPPQPCSISSTYSHSYSYLSLHRLPPQEAVNHAVFLKRHPCPMQGCQ